MPNTSWDPKPAIERLVRCHTGDQTVAVRLDDVAATQRFDQVEDGSVVDPASETGARLAVEWINEPRRDPREAVVLIVAVAPGVRRAFGFDRMTGLVLVPSTAVLPLPAIPGFKTPFRALVANKTFTGLLLGSVSALRSADTLAQETPARSRRMLTFSPAAGTTVRVGLVATQVCEISEGGPVVPVPGFPRHVAGFLAWRNRAVPVLDLSGTVGAIEGEALWDRLIVTRVIGAGVDAVALLAGSDVRFEDRFDEWQPVPVGPDDRPAVVTAFVRGTDRLLFLNLPELLGGSAG